MSWRTMPLSVRTFTPFEPSAGNGPAVSSAITPTDPPDEPVVPAAPAVVAEAVVAEPAFDPLELPDAPAVVPLASLLLDAQPTNASAPAPPRSRSMRRRLTRVDRSKARPRSWSWSSSWGGGGAVVMVRSSLDSLIGLLGVAGSNLGTARRTRSVAG